MLALAKQCSDLEQQHVRPRRWPSNCWRRSVEDAHVPRILRLLPRAAGRPLQLAQPRSWASGSRWTGRPAACSCGCGRATSGFDTDALYRRRFSEGVAFVPSSVFDPGGPLNSAMRLNFTRNGPEPMAEGVRRLARAIRAYLAGEA